MKRYGTVLLVTAVCIALVLFFGAAQKKTAVSVETVTLTAKTWERTVTCTGKVELSGSERVFSPAACVAGEIYVAVGDTVSVGTPLFRPDVVATRQALAQVGEAVSLTENDLPAVTATAAGVITELAVKEGELIDADTPCAVIAPGENLQIAATVREKYVQRVKAGQAVTVTGEGFEKPVYRGTVKQVAGTAHQQYIGTVSETVVDTIICLDPEEVDASLRAGLNAEASIVVETVENAVLIPYACIRQDEAGREYVYILDKGVAVRQVLEEAEETANGVLTVGGAFAGKRVVKEPDALSGERVAVSENG